MRLGILLQTFALVFALFGRVWGATYEVSEVSSLSISSAITPATYDYLEQKFKVLPKSALILIKLNTPGGLVTTTKEIITLFGKEERPIAVWITPQGASASSAGAIIASASHYIFMSPGTNMGAATPVGLGEDLKESDGKKKAMNDLKALVRSLSSSRGRPAEPFERMISDADSLTDKEALRAKIIDGVVSNPRDLLPLLRKRITLDGNDTLIQISENVPFTEYGPTVGQKILEVLANPTTAYFLFLIGVALLYFELQAPGGFIAGSIGLCFLILAGIAFQVLPLDWGSMGLILVGIFLLVLEIFVPSYGILGIAGGISFLTGSLFLFHGDAGFISVSYPLILSGFAGVAFALGLILWYLWRDQKKQKKQNFFLPLGVPGTVITKNPGSYQVKVHGGIWNAKSSEELSVGDTVSVIEADPDKLVITIEKMKETL
jgi:membrane-bound serine protease (ClpP class)